MYSACEDCLHIFAAAFSECPWCHGATEWLVQTYDVDARHVVTTTLDSTSSPEAVK